MSEPIPDQVTESTDSFNAVDDAQTNAWWTFVLKLGCAGYLSIALAELGSALVAWSDGVPVGPSGWKTTADLMRMLGTIYIVVWFLFAFLVVARAAVGWLAHRVLHLASGALLASITVCAVGFVSTRLAVNALEKGKLALVVPRGSLLVERIRSFGCKADECYEIAKAASPGFIGSTSFTINYRSDGSWTLRATVPSHQCSYAYVEYASDGHASEAPTKHLGDGWFFRCN